jgi:hypothetical protein
VRLPLPQPANANHCGPVRALGDYDDCVDKGLKKNCITPFRLKLESAFFADSFWHIREKTAYLFFTDNHAAALN